MLKKLTLLLSCYCCIISVALAEETMHDPTRPFGVAIVESTQQGNIHIDAILTGPNRNIVIIGGQRFTVGDKIGDAEIIEISPTEVHLQDDSGEYVIKLNATTIKKPTNKQP